MSTQTQHHDELDEGLDPRTDERARAAAANMKVAFWVGIVLSIGSTAALILISQG